MTHIEAIVDVTVTAPDVEWLAQFTRSIINDRLAASGNIVPAIRSIYRWQDVIEDQLEALAIFHTRRSLVPEFIERTNNEHPYDTAHVLATLITDADPAYHHWVIDSTRDPRR